ncbi:helix-turn-helix domain-containing protein [Ancylobacter mangrovi]|uniref:helix-turn-helix domain-containing protein n=1 Tax=Ancylobacter mangrovi TaxID=2972472 RepID=UPI0021639EF1|nr:helix-turn-helix transcriptional regulator [Ancylobacter mangrovi]MCS0501922.1 helix-turn-helix transcriptional regulator [Ancylobacter mangrovi]
MASLYREHYQAIIARLIRARKDAGVSQTELAERLGQRQTFVSKYELDERRLDVAEFIEISRAIGADLFELLRN